MVAFNGTSNLKTWFLGGGKQYDTVLSTRIRLSRNVRGYLFPANMSDAEEVDLSKRIKGFFKDFTFQKNHFHIHDLADISSQELGILAERREISGRSFYNRSGSCILNDDENIQITLYDTDHLRIGGARPGFQPDEVWKQLRMLNKKLEQNFPYAFSETFGYLTAQIKESGPGMKVSVMLQLLALSEQEEIDSLFIALMDMGFTIRGFSDGARGSVGGLYLFSNSTAFGDTERSLLDQMKKMVDFLVGKEKQARVRLLKNGNLELEDRVMRSLGIIKYCKMITSNEALEALSLIRLGLILGWIKKISIEKVTELLILTQDAHIESLLKSENKKLSFEEINSRRATFIRETLIV